MKDDFTARNGMKVTRAIDMGNSWKDDPSCLDTEAQVFPCDANPYCKTWALRKCQIIKDATFKDCHSKVRFFGKRHIQSKKNVLMLFMLMT